MNRNFIISLVLTTILLTGCTNQQTINVDATPTMQVPKTIEPAVKRKGALYSRKGASLFADKKDLQVGDIIQILIQETLTNDSSDSREIKKDNTTGIGIGNFSTPTGATGRASRFATKLNNNLGIGFSSKTGNAFKGTAKTSADEEFTTTISAIIEKTYQNGNYFIRGTKEMLINKQKQDMKISGVIRPYDISPENTVYSYQLANLKIMYEKDGEEMDALQKSWGTKLVEGIWPF